MEAFHVSKVPYLDVEDTISEVGITRRQLNHWEAQGLIQAQLGAGSNKYTMQDIQRLKALKHLIVDRKLPFPFVKELVNEGVDHSVKLGGRLIETAALFDKSNPNLSDYVLDFEAKALANRYSLATESWFRFFSIASEEQILTWLNDLIVLLFRAVRLRADKPAGFEERRSEILSAIERLSDMARIQVSYWDDPQDLNALLLPRLPQDEYRNINDLHYQFLAQAERLSKYRDALIRWKGKDDPTTKRNINRFWEDDALEGVRKAHGYGAYSPAPNDESTTSKEAVNDDQATSGEKSLSDQPDASDDDTF